MLYSTIPPTSMEGMKYITHSDGISGREWRSELEILGLPLVHIVQGCDEHGRALRAKGVIAVGQYATGFYCFSQFGVGVICTCQCGVGLISISQFAIGAWGMSQFGVFLRGMGQIAYSILGS